MGKNVVILNLPSLSKMCVLCIFHVYWELEGKENFREGIFLSKNLLG